MRLRAWDNEDNRMLQHKQICNLLACSNLGYDIFEDPIFTVMPSVNMLDYQGTEIYVGDIIADKFSRSTGLIFEIVETCGGYALIPFKNGFRMYAGGETPIDKETKYKVMGNIFQNKKLLDVRILD